MENETSISSSPTSVAMLKPTTSITTKETSSEEQQPQQQLSPKDLSEDFSMTSTPPLQDPPATPENDGYLPTKLSNADVDSLRYTTMESSTTLDSSSTANSSSSSTSSSSDDEDDDDDDDNDKVDPENWKDQFYVYEVPVPVTEWGLQLKLLNKNDECAVFHSFCSCPDGSVGPLESQGLIRSAGDVIIGVEGTDVRDKSFRETMGLISSCMKTSEEESWEEGVCEDCCVRIQFMDGEEYERRKNAVLEDEADDETNQSIMELNVAYEALEAMRKANLEIELGGSVDFDCCTQCLRIDFEEKKKEAANPNQKSRRSRIRFNNSHTKPCLVCGSPVCRKHCCQTFRKQNKIRICDECSPLFSQEFNISCLDIDISDEERRRNIDRMIVAYDRTRLLLKYSSQYIDEIANALQSNTKRNNGVTLGTCATSVTSSVMGAVGLATIFTPLGPHLLIASLLFSGSATAVQSGSEAVNYFAEPNKLADKIIAIHAMMRCILSVTDVFRSASLKEQVQVDSYSDDGSVKDGSVEEDENDERLANDNSKAAALATGAAVVVGGRRTRLVTRASATVMRSARVALAAGGALTAASILLETNEIIRVANKMRKGNPNKKADLIREIKLEVEDLPDTHVVAEECEKYFELMVARHKTTAALKEKQEEDASAGENNDVQDNLDGDVTDQSDVLDTICLGTDTSMKPTKQPQEAV